MATMGMSAENVRFILGLKLKKLRQDREVSLSTLASQSGLSVSYLSEIEKGKKYPKPDKLLELAKALGVPFDELVSLKVNEELSHLKAALSSNFVNEFPFELFGVEPEEIFELVSDEPKKAGALIQAFLEVGRNYDVKIEHFLFAALRAYQELNANYFEGLEEAAAEYRREKGWAEESSIDPSALKSVLENDLGYQIDETTLAGHPDLKGFRAVFLEGPPPRLLVNRQLLPSQKAFVYGREIAYRRLGLVERAATSSWLRVRSFQELLNNFQASYFSGALLIKRDHLRRDLKDFFSRKQFDSQVLLSCIGRYNVTPEMFFYRCTELMPKLFKLNALYFMRFSNEAQTDKFWLTKVFNMSPVPVPHGIGLNEHYCRRWLSMRLLRELSSRQLEGNSESPLLMAQRAHFMDDEAEFFVIAMARPLLLQKGVNSSVSLGFLMNEEFKSAVRFWNDPAIARIDVNLTCQRCPLSPEMCQDRVWPPVIYEREMDQQRKERALAELARQPEPV